MFKVIGDFGSLNHQSYFIINLLLYKQLVAEVLEATIIFKQKINMPVQ